MKKLVIFILFLLVVPFVLADYGMMGSEYGMMGGWGLFGLVYFVLAAFIFSVIFWLTYNWLIKGKKK